MVSVWLKPFIINHLCLLFLNHNGNRNYPNDPDQKFTYPSSYYRVLPPLTSMTAWSLLLYLWTRLFIFSDGEAPHSSSSFCKFLGCLPWSACLRSPQRGSMILRSGDWDGHFRTFFFLCCSQWQVDLALCFGSLSCPSASHAQLPGWWMQMFLQYFLMTYCIHLANNFDQIFLCLCSPQNISDPPPCFTVGMVYLSS